MSFWNPQGQNKGGDPNAPAPPPAPTFGSQPLGPSGNPFGFDNPNLYGGAYRGQNQPATWNGNSYTGPIDQSYQNTARGDQFTGTRDGFLWVAGNRLMPSFGDQARDRLELQTNFGVGGASPNTNPLWQGDAQPTAPPVASGSPTVSTPVAAASGSADANNFLGAPAASPAGAAPNASPPAFASGSQVPPVFPGLQAPSKPQVFNNPVLAENPNRRPVVNAMMRQYKRGQW